MRYRFYIVDETGATTGTDNPDKAHEMAQVDTNIVIDALDGLILVEDFEEPIPEQK